MNNKTFESRYSTIDFQNIDTIQYDTQNLKEATASASITSSANFNSYVATSSSEISDKLGDISHHKILSS